MPPPSDVPEVPSDSLPIDALPEDAPRAISDPRAISGPIEALPPPVLGDHEGVLLAERPGGAIECVLADGSTLALADGERVRFGDDPIDNAAAGAGPTVAQVTARGTSGYVSNASLLREARITREPGARYAVFYAVYSCTTRCRGRAVALGPGGARAVVLDDGGTDAVVSFDPLARNVAVGSRGLAVFSLERWARAPEGAGPDALARFTAPAYAPGGRLFVRGLGDDDAVFERAPEGALRRVLAHRGHPPALAVADNGAEASAPREADPVRFEPGGMVLRAPFARGRVTHTVRATLAGRALPSD